MNCQPKANNNREAVVVCARHVVKRPSKRMRASSKLRSNLLILILNFIFKKNCFTIPDKGETITI